MTKIRLISFFSGMPLPILCSTFYYLLTGGWTNPNNSPGDGFIFLIFLAIFLAIYAFCLLIQLLICALVKVFLKDKFDLLYSFLGFLLVVTITATLIFAPLFFTSQTRAKTNNISIENSISSSDLR
jgi:hypothetical protein